MNKQCAVCHSAFSVRESHASKRKTCSARCGRAYRSVTYVGKNNPAWKGGDSQKKCLICGTTFSVDHGLGATAKFCSRICFHRHMANVMPGRKLPQNSKKGPQSPGWKGGRRKTKAGYILLYAPDHPDSHKSGYILEHRLIMSLHVGRRLLSTEDVHHHNGIKDDNRLENLELMDHRDHISMDNAQKGKPYWGINSGRSPS